MRLQTGEQTPAPTKPKAFYKALYFQVVVGLTLGILAGHFWPDLGASLKPLGDGFVKLVKMMIAPVVFCTIVSGITSLNDTREIGKTLVKSMALFYALTVAALLIGLAAVMIIEPGVGMHVSAASLDPTVAARYAKQAAPVGFTDFVLHIIPHSFFGAFAEGEVLPVLLISVLVGFGLTRVGKAGEPVVQGIESFSHVLFAAFGFIMKLAPIGAFGAMAFTVGKYGIDSIGSLGLLILTFYVACGVFLMVVIGTLARLHGFSLWKVLRYFREELLIVLGTSSSEPVLPRVLQKLEALGCKKGVSGLVLPMGYSFNLDGTAIYLTLASLFIAQACDIHLSGGQIFAMLGVMLLTSKGAAGVTGSGFVALVATLTVMPDLPVAGVALLVGIDRFMSEARALTSIISNCVASIVVSIWENACDREVLQRELNQSYASTERCLEEKGDIAVLPLNAPAQPSH
ncbi:dicarboxylate/amino acid:cation symporter (plasmid) [Azospirillum baldaniorum]|uniref:C4-dicarboxylate transport protein n=1 Tax=Azospirillum baldaniorum TaxID=1064539 RepID=A0A9P1NRB8_9PROT|nr:C4-dicarboxylate transporter DctA [Azospirillum baldaniorum]TWA78155.1 Na+/H+-dicarboxylate symporter [Azospirillum brasilense]AWJ92743.1 dicarboxylate/amino acid:cation symporter [Azospirillum baldaniorum]NUB05023.1 C4-dicarboxylate transporter DctA [Azospirillum baldaniorum]TWA63604.1 Na+/H+-dicarboxylate symporter [Azospirillum baldaniorum]CCD02729.1 C4-dicarboxylate transport protein [Azospirillum baldaniorum]